MVLMGTQGQGSMDCPTRGHGEPTPDCAQGERVWPSQQGPLHSEGGAKPCLCREWKVLVGVHAGRSCRAGRGGGLTAQQPRPLHQSQCPSAQNSLEFHPGCGHFPSKP